MSCSNTLIGKLNWFNFKCSCSCPGIGRILLRGSHGVQALPVNTKYKHSNKMLNVKEKVNLTYFREKVPPLLCSYNSTLLVSELQPPDVSRRKVVAPGLICKAISFSS